MRFLKKPTQGQATALSTMFLAAVVVFWLRQARFVLPTPLGWSEFVADRSHFYFSNQEQRARDVATASRELGRRMNEEYAAAREAYENSGRDLAAPDSEALRLSIEEHRRRGAELNEELAARLFEVDQKWLKRPPVNFSVPVAIPVAALSILPLVWLFREVRRRWQSVPPGHCPRCGYDLRATPGRCPECGTPSASQ